MRSHQQAVGRFAKWRGGKGAVGGGKGGGGVAGGQRLVGVVLT